MTPRSTQQHWHETGAKSGGAPRIGIADKAELTADISSMVHKANKVVEEGSDDNKGAYWELEKYRKNESDHLILII